MRLSRGTVPILLVGVWCVFVAATAEAVAPVADLRGIDFHGGGQSRFGASQYGREGVNYVYARPTGDAATMTATFALSQARQAPMFLYVEGCDDDPAAQCDVEISINGKVLHAGPSGFPNAAWKVRKFAIPKEAMKTGNNELRIANRHEQGVLGMPPWFMVARCAIAADGYELPAFKSATGVLPLELPTKLRPLPEPLPAGEQPGFKLRGIKGWAWTSEQYLSEIPVLVEYKMNFLMNCYVSLFASDDWHWGENSNRWWQPFSEKKRLALEKVIRTAQKHGLQFCFSMNPQLFSSRPLNPQSNEDFEKLWPHYAWAQGLGVKWFNLCLDDIQVMPGLRIDAAEHCKFVNKLFTRLREKDAGVRFIFCTTYYGGNGNEPEAVAYLDTVARDLNPEIYIFWTGDTFTRITRAAAESYKKRVKHRLILWDNYPVNDAQQTIHMGPVTARDPDLCDVIDGYMSNPMCGQNEVNRIPMATCADYAYNPKGYDPTRSIGQAILHLAETAAQRGVLLDLVEAYPGFILYPGGTGTNPPRIEFQKLMAARNHYLARNMLRHLEDIARRLEREFPDRYTATKRTLGADIEWMKTTLNHGADQGAKP
jgi:hypothetical protein